jgi:tetratricopeptide (TPR) repeat protein
MEKIADLIVKQWKGFAAALVVLVLVLGAVGVWKEIKSRRDRDATNMLYEAQVAARKSIEAKNPDEAEKAYEGLLSKFKGTRAAFEAHLHIGDLWMDAGSHEKAFPHYQAAVASANDPFSRLIAHYTLGVSRESSGKFQEAVSSYEEALKIQGSDFLRPEILMAQARCYEGLQQPAKAIELYKTVQDKFASRSYYSGAASAFEKQLSSKQM